MKYADIILVNKILNSVAPTVTLWKNGMVGISLLIEVTASHSAVVMCDTTYFLSDLIPIKTQSGITNTNTDTDTLYKKWQGRKKRLQTTETEKLKNCNSDLYICIYFGIYLLYNHKMAFLSSKDEGNSRCLNINKMKPKMTNVTIATYSLCT